MLAFLQYLIAYFLCQDWPGSKPAAEDPPDLAGIALFVSAFAAAAAVSGLVLRRRLLRAPEQQIAGHLVRASNLARLVTLAVFYVIAQPLGGRHLPLLAGVEDWVLVPHVVRLLPFFVLAFTMRAGLRPAQRAVGYGPRTFGESLGIEAKQALLPLLPLLVLVVIEDLIRLAPPGTLLFDLREPLARMEVFQALFLLAVLMLALCVLPFALRIAWRARPLADGPLRRRLEAYAARVGFRSRDILVWPSGRNLINAAVVGPFARFRYAVLTDGLLAHLDDDEIEAVFAHEAGHARRGHILMFFGFTSILLLAGLLPGALGGSVAGLLGGLAAPVRVLAVLVLWMGVVFGWVSRRFEQEADVYGLETVPLPTSPDGMPLDPHLHPFSRALERIAEEAGGIREITGWRHFSVADRVAFLRAYLTDVDVRRRYKRSITILRTAIVAAVCGCLVLVLVRIPADLAAWEFERTPAVRMLRALANAVASPDPLERAAYLDVAADRAREAGRLEEEVRWRREAVALLREHPETDPAPGQLAAYADALERSGRRRGAALAWQEVAADRDAGTGLRSRAEERLRALGAEGP